MKYLLLGVMLAALAACGTAGVDPQTAQCPDNQDQTLSRGQWEACYGYQDHDSGGPGS